MVLVVGVDGLMVSRITVRWTHWWGGALPFEIAWDVWSIFQSLVFDIGNPNSTDNDPDTNDDAIYSALDWKGSGVSAAILGLLALFVLGPIVYAVIWLCSWYKWPCCCRGGSRRRYVDGASTNDERV